MEVAVAESSLEANDDNLRIKEQLCTPGFLKSLNGADVHGPGISLEVNLGHLYGPVEYNRSDIVVRGPNIQPNGLTNSIWAPKRPSMPTVQTSPHGARSSRINDQKSKRKDKRKVSFAGASKSANEVSGYAYLARLYGHKGASSSKSSPKCAVFRAAAAALSLSASNESHSGSRSHILSEAQANIQLGKILGINYKGKEAEVLEKMVDLEVVDRARRKTKKKE
ncbi:hypothetical protein CsSME_00011509 [Camellia sinensis var. sinensis]